MKPIYFVFIFGAIFIGLICYRFLNKNTVSKIREIPSEWYDQMVLIQYPISNSFGSSEEVTEMHALEDSLDELLKSQHIGFADGNEIGMGQADIYLYGPDADVVFTAIKPTLKKSRMSDTMKITIRYGDVNDPQAQTVKKALEE